MIALFLVEMRGLFRNSVKMVLLERKNVFELDGLNFFSVF